MRKRMSNLMIKLIWFILFALSCTGCSNMYSDAVMSYMPVIESFTCYDYTTIKIQSKRCTNDGAPFCVVIKPTNFRTFLMDDYEKIVELAFNPPEDQECIKICNVVPGKDFSVSIDTPEVDALGIYFLFTHPGGMWKDIVELREGCTTVKIILDRNEIASIEK